MKAADKTFVPASASLPAYTLIRADRLTMEIRITPFTGEIVLRIPRRTAKKTAEEFLIRNLSAVMDSVAHAKAMTPGRMYAELSADEAAALKKLANEVIPDRVRYWTQQLGLPMPDKISYTAAQKRFGSCRQYPDGRVHLCFSYRLMQFPDAAVDAVVLHEVAHMCHPDHSKHFYALILTHMPDYHARHALLSENE